MDRSGMAEQCRLHMPVKILTKEPKGATLSNITCLNPADQGHLRTLLSLKKCDRIKLDRRKSVILLFFGYNR